MGYSAERIKTFVEHSERFQEIKILTADGNITSVKGIRDGKEIFLSENDIMVLAKNYIMDTYGHAIFSGKMFNSQGYSAIQYSPDTDVCSECGGDICSSWKTDEHSEAEAVSTIINIIMDEEETCQEF